MFLNYFLISLLCFFSPLIGILLGYNSPEEIRPYKKKFYFLRIIVFWVILALFLAFNFKMSYYVTAVLVFGIVVSFLKKSYLDYIFFGLVFALFNVYLVSLIFLYGMVEGLIFKSENKKFILKKYLLNYIWFICASVLLYWFLL